MSVCSSTNTAFLTHKRWSDRPTEEKRRRRSLSPSKDETPAKSHHKDRGGRLRSTRTRRRRAPVDATGMWRGTLLKRTARRTRHASKANDTHNKQPATQKNSTRRERLAQARTTNQGPGPARPRRPLHIIERPRQQSRATKASPSRRGTHRNTLGPPSKT